MAADDLGGGLRFAAALAGLTGAVDAVGFLKLGSLFPASMGANTTQVGVYAVLHEDGALARALTLVGLFAAGAFCGGALGWAAGERRTASLLYIEAALLLAAAALLRGGSSGLGFAAMALAMGLLTAAWRSGGAARPPIAMTAVLADIGAGLASRLTGEVSRGSAGADLLLWMSLVLGAAAGTALYLRFSVLTLVGPAVLAILLALGGRSQAARVGTTS